MRRTVAARLRDRDVSRHRAVLDVGCGVGTHVRLLADAVHSHASVLGVDRSGTMLQAAREHGGERTRFVRADAHALPFAAASFDLVWVERTLVHLADPLRALREVHRVLAEQGRALITEGDYAGALLDAPDEELWRLLKSRWVGRLTNPALGRTLPRLLSEAGFPCVELFPELRTLAGVQWVQRAFGLHRRSQELIEQGLATEARVEAFWAELERRDHAGCFFMAIPFLVANASAS
ncbi:MAG: methyltransferase domain-containing protein [Myxococcales bacterium]|nr:methyltransferase domain-containing protein [Myxococcales bacterium]